MEAVEIAFNRLNHAPYIVSNYQRVATWCDIKEIFLWCPHPSCKVVLTALKCLLKYPESEKCMHPCSESEQLLFLKQFMVVPHGTLLVDLSTLKNRELLTTLYEMVRRKHVKSSNSVILACSKVRQEIVAKYCNTSIKVPLHSLREIKVLPAVTRAHYKDNISEVKNDEFCNGQLVKIKLTVTEVNSSFEGSVMPNRNAPISSDMFVALSMLQTLVPGSSSFLTKLTELYPVVRCDAYNVFSLSPCQLLEGIQLTRFLACQYGYDVPWQCVTSSSLMMSLREFWASYTRELRSLSDTLAPVADFSVIALTCQIGGIRSPEKSGKKLPAAPKTSETGPSNKESSKLKEENKKDSVKGHKDTRSKLIKTHSDPCVMARANESKKGEVVHSDLDSVTCRDQVLQDDSVGASASKSDVSLTRHRRNVKNGNKFMNADPAVDKRVPSSKSCESVGYGKMKLVAGKQVVNAVHKVIGKKQKCDIEKHLKKVLGYEKGIRQAVDNETEKSTNASTRKAKKTVVKKSVKVKREMSKAEIADKNPNCERGHARSKIKTDGRMEGNTLNNSTKCEPRKEITGIVYEKRTDSNNSAVTMNGLIPGSRRSVAIETTGAQMQIIRGKNKKLGPQMFKITGHGTKGSLKKNINKHREVGQKDTNLESVPKTMMESDDVINYPLNLSAAGNRENTCQEKCEEGKIEISFVKKATYESCLDKSESLQELNNSLIDLISHTRQNVNLSNSEDRKVLQCGSAKMHDNLPGILRVATKQKSPMKQLLQFSLCQNSADNIGKDVTIKHESHEPMVSGKHLKHSSQQTSYAITPKEVELIAPSLQSEFLHREQQPFSYKPVRSQNTRAFVEEYFCKSPTLVIDDDSFPIVEGNQINVSHRNYHGKNMPLFAQIPSKSAQLYSEVKRTPRLKAYSANSVGRLQEEIMTKLQERAIKSIYSVEGNSDNDFMTEGVGMWRKIQKPRNCRKAKSADIYQRKQKDDMFKPASSICSTKSSNIVESRSFMRGINYNYSQDLRSSAERAGFVQGYGSSSSTTPDIYDEFARKKKPKARRTMSSPKPKPLTKPVSPNLHRTVARKGTPVAAQEKPIPSTHSFHTVGYLFKPKADGNLPENTNGAFTAKQIYEHKKSEANNLPVMAPCYFQRSKDRLSILTSQPNLDDNTTKRPLDVENHPKLEQSPSFSQMHVVQQRYSTDENIQVPELNHWSQTQNKAPGQDHVGTANSPVNSRTSIDSFSSYFSSHSKVRSLDISKPSLRSQCNSDEQQHDPKGCEKRSTRVTLLDKMTSFFEHFGNPKPSSSFESLNNIQNVAQMKNLPSETTLTSLISITPFMKNNEVSSRVVPHNQNPNQNASVFYDTEGKRTIKSLSRIKTQMYFKVSGDDTLYAVGKGIFIPENAQFYALSEEDQMEMTQSYCKNDHQDLQKLVGKNSLREELKSERDDHHLVENGAMFDFEAHNEASVDVDAVLKRICLDMEERDNLGNDVSTHLSQIKELLKKYGNKKNQTEIQSSDKVKASSPNAYSKDISIESHSKSFKEVVEEKRALKKRDDEELANKFCTSAQESLPSHAKWEGKKKCARNNQIVNDLLLTENSRKSTVAFHGLKNLDNNTDCKTNECVLNRSRPITEGNVPSPKRTEGNVPSPRRAFIAISREQARAQTFKKEVNAVPEEIGKRRNSPEVVKKCTSKALKSGGKSKTSKCKQKSDITLPRKESTHCSIEDGSPNIIPALRRLWIENPTSAKLKAKQCIHRAHDKKNLSQGQRYQLKESDTTQSQMSLTNQRGQEPNAIESGPMYLKKEDSHENFISKMDTEQLMSSQFGTEKEIPQKDCFVLLKKLKNLECENSNASTESNVYYSNQCEISSMKLNKENEVLDRHSKQEYTICEDGEHPIGDKVFQTTPDQWIPNQKQGRRFEESDAVNLNGKTTFITQGTEHLLQDNIIETPLNTSRNVFRSFNSESGDIEEAVLNWNTNYEEFTTENLVDDCETVAFSEENFDQNTIPGDSVAYIDEVMVKTEPYAEHVLGSTSKRNVNSECCDAKFSSQILATYDLKSDVSDTIVEQPGKDFNILTDPFLCDVCTISVEPYDDGVMLICTNANGRTFQIDQNHPSYETVIEMYNCQAMETENFGKEAFSDSENSDFYGICGTFSEEEKEDIYVIADSNVGNIIDCESWEVTREEIDAREGTSYEYCDVNDVVQSVSQGFHETDRKRSMASSNISTGLKILNVVGSYGNHSFQNCSDTNNKDVVKHHDMEKDNNTCDDVTTLVQSKVENGQALSKCNSENRTYKVKCHLKKTKKMSSLRKTDGDNATARPNYVANNESYTTIPGDNKAGLETDTDESFDKESDLDPSASDKSDKDYKPTDDEPDAESSDSTDAESMYSDENVEDIGRKRAKKRVSKCKPIGFKCPKRKNGNSSLNKIRKQFQKKYDVKNTAIINKWFKKSRKLVQNDSSAENFGKLKHLKEDTKNERSFLKDYYRKTIVKKGQPKKCKQDKKSVLNIQLRNDSQKISREDGIFKKNDRLTLSNDKLATSNDKTDIQNVAIKCVEENKEKGKSQCSDFKVGIIHEKSGVDKSDKNIGLTKSMRGSENCESLQDSWNEKLTNKQKHRGTLMNEAESHTLHIDKSEMSNAYIDSCSDMADSESVSSERKLRRGKKRRSTIIKDREEEISEEEKEKQEENTAAAEGFIKTQMKYYDIIKNTSSDSSKMKKQDNATNRLTRVKPGPVPSGTPVRGEREITKAMSEAEKALEGTGGAQTGDSEDEGTIIEDLINSCRYQLVEDEDGLQLGGVAHFSDYALPFVYINGYKYTPLKDVLALFQPSCCPCQCTIPRSVFTKHKSLVKTFSTWEQRQ
ncbi:uncharacterized protein LOC127847239 isoform X2 [Dreissena polymorpha]|uniref:uncharacterized protein LOC127847239 isoform X2 n=1 Tax=Dreissena polymorpha TaxID=45954 RepID=UPI0022643D92|nr:uncharacterized protein LOC127847239 isoform X2 [Dreissena polymorpha]